MDRATITLKILKEEIKKIERKYDKIAPCETVY